MARILSLSCSGRAVLLKVIKRTVESYCTVITCDLPAHHTRRSPSIVSLHVRVCSLVIAFHSSHFAITVSVTCFQTRGASATAASLFSFSSYLSPPSALLPPSHSFPPPFL